MHTVLERGRDAHRNPLCAFILYSSTACVHSYYFPILYHAFFIAFYCISIPFLLHFHCISITFPLYFHCISYALHFHCISFPALLACINIIPCFILALTLFLVLTLFLAFTHVCILILLIQALFWLHLHTFAFLLYSSTFLVAFTQCSGSNSFKNKRHGPIRNPFDKTSCRFSHFGIHVPFNFYHFNTNFSLPVLLKV